MIEFHHHPDGYYIFRKPAADPVSYSAAELTAALGLAAPSLPAGIIERIYRDTPAGGQPRHVLTTSDHAATGGPDPWEEGDALIAAFAALP